MNPQEKGKVRRSTSNFPLRESNISFGLFVRFHLLNFENARHRTILVRLLAFSKFISELDQKSSKELYIESGFHIKKPKNSLLYRLSTLRTLDYNLSMSKKTLLSGIQPSGKAHIGNYFGLMTRMVEFQDEYQCYFFIADYHSLNTVQDKNILKQNIIDIVLDYCAIGFDPKKSIIFKQSDVSEHTELAWIFDTITTMPYLERAHAYKDAKDKGKEISVGTFNYPMLMAADILLYDTHLVPTGQDQKQHVEISRDTAEKFNRVYGQEIFVLPEPKIIEELAVVPGVDGRKMSKSYNNTIPLFAEDDEIEKAVMSIVTDSSGEKPENVYAIHALIKPKEGLDALYEQHKGQYKVLKEMLIADLKNFIRPMREKRKQLADDTDFVLDVLKEGGVRAKQKAEKKMEAVRDAVGVKLY